MREEGGWEGGRRVLLPEFQQWFDPDLRAPPFVQLLNSSHPLFLLFVNIFISRDEGAAFVCLIHLFF